MEGFFNIGWWISILPTLFPWWGAVFVASVVSLPITAILFRGLPDKGASLAPVLGILLLNWTSFVISFPHEARPGPFLLLRVLMLLLALGITMLVTLYLYRQKVERLPPVAFLPGAYFLCLAVLSVPHGFASMLMAFFLVAVISVFIVYANRKQAVQFIRTSGFNYVVSLLVFTFAFLFFAGIRSYIPWVTFDINLYAAEKWGNFTHLQSVMRTSTMPPTDLWYFQQPLNYYYGGHLLTGTLAKTFGTDPEVAFNIGLALIVGLTASGSYALGSNFFARRSFRYRGRKFHHIQTILWGVTMALAVTAFGNWHSIRQVASELKIENRAAQESLINSMLRIDFWSPSRAIKGSPPNISEPGTITEFPAFSAILGDHHPHHAALPYTLCALCAILSLLRIVALVRRPNLWKLLIPTMTLSLMIGLVFFVNIWDSVVLSVLYLFVFVYTASIMGRSLVTRLALTGSQYLLCGLAALVIASPFLLFFQNPVTPRTPLFDRNTEFLWSKELRIADREQFWPTLWSTSPINPVPADLRTEFVGFATHWGIFALPIILFLGIALYLHPRLSRIRRPFFTVWLIITAAFLIGLGSYLLAVLLVAGLILLHVANDRIESLHDGTLLLLTVASITSYLYTSSVVSSAAILIPTFTLFALGLYLILLQESIRGLAFTCIVVALAFFSYAQTHYILPSLLIGWMGICLFLLPSARSFTLRAFHLLSLTCCFWFLFCEFLKFDDDYIGYLERYNTVFKIYYPLWPMMALMAVFSLRNVCTSIWRWFATCRLLIELVILLTILAALSIVYMLNTAGFTILATLLFILLVGPLLIALAIVLVDISGELGEKFRIIAKRYIGGFLAVGSLAGFLVVGLHYPLAATATRTLWFHNDPSIKNLSNARLYEERTLDGLQHFTTDPDFQQDYTAALWMRENISKDAVILEYVSPVAYSSGSRISTMSGRQTILNWLHHEEQWRGRSGAVPSWLRQRFVEAGYQDWELEGTVSQLRSLLVDRIALYYLYPADYADFFQAFGVDYVYIGGLERRHYGESIGAAPDWELVYEDDVTPNPVRIYRIKP